MAFLIDAGWMEVIVGAVAIILTIVIYFRGRKRKYLSYEVLSESPLISISDEIKGNLQVLFNGKPVENVHLLLVKFINNGNVPVAASDYERPLSLKLEGNSDILSAEFVESAPANLSPSLKVNDKVVEFAPTLMNAGDSFTAKVLVGEYGGRFEVDARVLGIKFVREVSKNEKRMGDRVTLVAGVVFMLIVVTLLIVSTSKPDPPRIINIRPSKDIIYPNEVIRLTSFVIAENGEALFKWTATNGKIIDLGRKDEVDYVAPDSNIDMIMLSVSDDYGRTTTESIYLTISEPLPYHSPVRPSATPTK